MEAYKTVVESKSGIRYLVIQVSANGGSIWGTSIVNGRFRGNTRAMNAANVKVIGTATVTHDGSASLITLDGGA